jgi:hypothetical protein
VLQHRLPVDQLVGFGEEIRTRGGRVPELPIVEGEFRLGVEVFGVVDIFAVAYITIV